MCPKIFISGCWNDRLKLHEIMGRFEKIAEITHDWTIHESEELLTNNSYLKCQTILNVDGMDRTDYLIVVMDVPNYSYINTWIEIGMAISTGTPILLYNTINDTFKQNIYLHHPLVIKFDSLNKIAEYLKQE